MAMLILEILRSCGSKYSHWRIFQFLSAVISSFKLSKPSQKMLVIIAISATVICGWAYTKRIPIPAGVGDFACLYLTSTTNGHRQPILKTNRQQMEVQKVSLKQTIINIILRGK